MTRILLSLILCCVPLLANAEFRFGVISPHDTESSIRWEPMEAYFSKALDAPVKIAVYPPNRVGRELVTGTLDFALVNPAIAVEVIESGAALPIGTLKVNGQAYFAGAIIARRDRNISTLADLKDKNVLAHQKSSAGAYIFQLYHLRKNGIDPFKDFKSLRHNDNQDYIVAAVYTGRIDAGFVRSGIIEALAAEGKINLEKLVVIDERHDELKYRHTTELYPERYLVVSRKLDPALRTRLERAALSLTPDDPATRAAGFDGFVKPLSLEKMKEVLRTLQLPPYAPCQANAAPANGCTAPLQAANRQDR